jgi:hypothetical protein
VGKGEKNYVKNSVKNGVKNGVKGRERACGDLCVGFFS